MTAQSRPQRSHLFTVRLWLETWGDGQAEWRGQAQHVLSGEVRYFRQWKELIAFVREQVGDTHEKSSSEGNCS